MATMQKIQTIHRKFNSRYMLFCSILFVIGCAIIITIITNNAKEDINQDIHQWVKFISAQSAKNLLNNERKTLTDELQILKTVNNLSYVHIFKLLDNDQKDNNQKIEHFTSFRRDTRFHIMPKNVTEIRALFTAKFSDDFVEMTAPIKNKQQVIGYLYIRLSLNELNHQLLRTTVFIFIIATIVLLSSLVIISKLLQGVIEAISELINNIQEITYQKDFSIRCDTLPYQELNALSQNINLMLNRTEKQITKQVQAEQQVIQLNSELENKVNQRTEALKESNQELLTTLETMHQYQGQLVESEKMASLGDMVAGVAHEVNTPIGLGVTSSSLLFDRLTEIKQAFENKTLKSSQLKRFLSDGEENLDIIMRNLKRAADLITSFKQVAVDQSSSEQRKFNFKGLLSEVILTLAPQLKNTPYTIEIDCPEDLIVISKPGSINQILVNLIVNSIIHGFDNQDFGKISITVIQLKNQINIHYCDDGIGINQDIKAKMFDPFITTKRGSGGSGLGMHLVYNLVTQALNGTISFESETNKGVTFDIDFPIAN